MATQVVVWDGLRKLSSTNSELYHADGASAGYDSLNRLTAFQRGTLSDANSDGVYDTVPSKHKVATRFDQLTYDDVIARDLQVMDTAAFALCRDSDVPLRIYDLSVPGNLMRILRGEPIGTLVKGRG